MNSFRKIRLNHFNIIGSGTFYFFRTKETDECVTCFRSRLLLSFQVANFFPVRSLLQVNANLAGFNSLFCG